MEKNFNLSPMSCIIDSNTITTTSGVISNAKNATRKNTGPIISQNHRFRSLFCALEWDSGADIGYFEAIPYYQYSNNKLSTIERMALESGLSVAMAESPEDILGETQSEEFSNSPWHDSKAKPNANSTFQTSGNKNEENTAIPLGKNLQSAAESTNNMDEPSDPKPSIEKNPSLDKAEDKGSGSKNYNSDHLKCFLRKSASMNLSNDLFQFGLKKSHSDFNLYGNNKLSSCTNHNSAICINKLIERPVMCNKKVQTCASEYSQESIGIQASGCNTLDKIPSQNKDSSLNMLCPISNLDQEKIKHHIGDVEARAEENLSEVSDSISGTSQPVDSVNNTGRAYSFEYMPGNLYEKIPKKKRSSVGTGESNSTRPKTSTSYEDKLEGDSENSFDDLKKSLDILKSLIEAKKLNAKVKRRLIHNMIKRLVNVKHANERKDLYRGDCSPWTQNHTSHRNDEIRNARDLKKSSIYSTYNGRSRAAKFLKNTVSNDNYMHKKENNHVTCNEHLKYYEKIHISGRRARMSNRDNEYQYFQSNNNTTSGSESPYYLLPQKYQSKKKRIVQHPSEVITDNLGEQEDYTSKNTKNKRLSQSSLSDDDLSTLDWRIPTTKAERQFEFQRYASSESGERKLLNYVEIEKQNQLEWISHEISYLLHLKQLLEQPKSSDKTKKFPRNKFEQNIHEHRDSQNNENFLEFSKAKINQWSSHGNLSKRSTNSKTLGKLVRKRNSSTQTGIDACLAYSKTGCEMILVNLINTSANKYKDVQVQTYNQNVNSERSNQKCFLHSLMPHSCEQNTLESEKKSPERKSSPLITLSSNSGKNETFESHLNNMFSCKMQNKCCNTSREFNHSNTIDKNVHKEIVSDSHKHTCQMHKSSSNIKKLNSGNRNSCRKGTSHDSISTIVDCEGMKIRKSKQYFEEKSKLHSCSCEAKHLENNISKNKKSVSDSDLYNENEISKQCITSDENTSSPSESVNEIIEPNVSIREKRSRYCHLCGKLFQSDRRCRCKIKYPNSVAYELVFINKDNSKEQLRKSKKYDVRKAHFEMSSPDLSKRYVSRGNSPITIESQLAGSAQKISTLQDHLISNKPRLVHNLDYRRQYLQGISINRHCSLSRQMEFLSLASSMDTGSKSCTDKRSERFGFREGVKGKYKKPYTQLSEIQTKRKYQQRQQEKRSNLLRAKIFCKKLQQKVLQGQVDLCRTLSIMTNF